jgi:Ala-tRNA(Pro) deacylase
MPASPADLFALLDRLAIPHVTTEHEAVFTVAESASVKERIPGGHTKNLFLKDKRGRLFLVTAEAHTPIDLKRLHETLGASGRLSFGSADLLRATLGVEPGSVTPLAVMNDAPASVEVTLDAALMAYTQVNVHPLVNTATTTLAREDLVRFLEATGHPPRILALPKPDDTGGSGGGAPS